MANSRFLLENDLFEDLKKYLEEKKTAINHTLLYSLSLFRKEINPPLIPPNETSKLKYSLNIFNDIVDNANEKDLRHISFESIADKLSEIVWSYVEILEGMSVQLFDEVHSYPIDSWNSHFYAKVESAKILINDDLLEMKEFIKNINVSLKKLSLKVLKNEKFSFFKKIRVSIHPAIDPDILKNIGKSQRYLHEKFQTFSKKYKFVFKNNEIIDQENYQFDNYRAFHSLEPTKADYILRLNRLLKLWKKARSDSHEIKSEIADLILNDFSLEKTQLNFNSYLNHIKRYLYQLANGWRDKQEHSAQAIVLGFRAELSNLLKLSAMTRDLLKNKNTNHLKDLEEKIKDTDRLFVELMISQEEKEADDPFTTLHHFKTIDHILHDIGQPLAAKSYIKRRSVELIHELSQIHELTNSLKEATQLMRDALIKSLKVDTKTFTLINNQAFQKILEIHLNLNPFSRSSHHLKRIKSLKNVLDYIKIDSLPAERNHEIHDISEILQEFYHFLPANLEGVLGAEKEIDDFKKQILEYRLIFADFFNSTTQSVPPEFAFIEHYLSTIEVKVNELRSHVN